MSDHEVTFDQDLDDVDGEEFADLKLGGPQLFELMDLRVRERQDKQGYYLNAEFQVVDVEDAELQGNIDRKHWDIFALTEKALWRIKAFVSKFVTDDDGPLGGTFNQEWCDRWIGRYIVAHLKTESYKNQVKTRMFKFTRADDWDGMNFEMKDGKLIMVGGEEAPQLPEKSNSKSSKGGREVTI